jgi:hypothetical protein
MSLTEYAQDLRVGKECPLCVSPLREEIAEARRAMRVGRGTIRRWLAAEHGMQASSYRIEKHLAEHD